MEKQTKLEIILAKLTIMAEQKLKRARQVLDNEGYLALTKQASEKLTAEEKHALSLHEAALMEQADWAIVLDIVNGAREIVSKEEIHE